MAAGGAEGKSGSGRRTSATGNKGKKQHPLTGGILMTEYAILKSDGGFSQLVRCPKYLYLVSILDMIFEDGDSELPKGCKWCIDELEESERGGR